MDGAPPRDPGDEEPRTAGREGLGSLGDPALLVAVVTGALYLGGSEYYAAFHGALSIPRGEIVLPTAAYLFEGGKWAAITLGLPLAASLYLGRLPIRHWLHALGANLFVAVALALAAGSAAVELGGSWRDRALLLGTLLFGVLPLAVMFVRWAVAGRRSLLAYLWGKGAFGRLGIAALVAVSIVSMGSVLGAVHGANFANGNLANTFAIQVVTDGSGFDNRTFYVVAHANGQYYLLDPEAWPRTHRIEILPESRVLEARSWRVG